MTRNIYAIVIGHENKNEHRHWFFHSSSTKIPPLFRKDAESVQKVVNGAVTAFGHYVALQ